LISIEGSGCFAARKQACGNNQCNNSYEVHGVCFLRKLKECARILGVFWNVKSAVVAGR
jgi:hypothetical protein